MDYKNIQELIQAVSESNLTTVEIENEGFRIVLKKEADKVVHKEAAPELTRQIAESLSIGQQDRLELQKQVTEENKAEALKDEDDSQLIKSPIVGTFYAASSPGAEPFVQANQIVKKGYVMCIIEAMKLMNEIEADLDMEVLEVLVSDGEMVEYGQALFRVRPL